MRCTVFVPQSQLHISVRIALLVLFCAACERVPVPEPPAAAPAQVTVDAEPRYLREFIFVGVLADAPLVVPFSFSAVEQEGEIGRTAQGWLGHGPTWDAFLDERWSGPAAGGVWRILPRPEVRVIAGGSTELDALVFRRGERALRLQMNEALSAWSGRDEIRYRLLRGHLHFRGTVVPGTVLETQQILRPARSTAEGGGEFDWLFLTDGGSLRLLLSEAMGSARERKPTFAWVPLPDGERSWDRAEIRWQELRPFPDARRDIPVRWSYRIPEAGWEGEVWSLGSAAEVGLERGGRRAVEIRHTVEGWASLEGGERRRVVGMMRHGQE